MKLVQIPANNLQDVWPLVGEQLIAAVQRSNGRFTPESLTRNVSSGDWQLWIGWDEDKSEAAAVAITELSEFPSGEHWGNIVIGTSVNNHPRKEWVVLKKELEKWAKENGCVGMQAWARRGWKKEFTDYRESHILLEKRFES